MKKTIEVSINSNQEEIMESIYKVYPELINGDIRKVIFIKGKIINVII